MKKLVLLAGACCLAASSIFANTATQPADRLKEPWWEGRMADKMRKAEADSYPIVFMGDSITHGWEGAGKEQFKKYFGDKKILNLANSGDKTQHTLWIIERVNWKKVNAKVIMLMIGTNNVGSNQAKETFEGVKAILDLLKEKAPDTKVLLLPIFPRGALASDPFRVKNSHVNADLPLLADGKRVIFYDINAKFLESDGATLSTDIMKDLLHPLPAGYEIWGQAVKDKLDELSK